jgi:hypothetical protein
MSIQINVRQLVLDGKPILFWRNRYDAFNVGSESIAYSGKLAIIKTLVDGLKGFPMVVEYRMARRTHIETWRTYFNSGPFNTTALADYFNTGHKVIFRLRDPITQQNEIIRDYDIFQTIFDLSSLDYRRGFDYFRGTLNLVIVE